MHSLCLVTRRGLTDIGFSYAVIGVVVAGGTWYLSRLARGPTGARSRGLLLQRTMLTPR